jgi:hypothetical protein
LHYPDLILAEMVIGRYPEAAARARAYRHYVVLDVSVVGR